MYLYFKGKSFLCEERLFTYKEIAKEYNCYFWEGNQLLPNANFVAIIINNYSIANNYQEEYFFINSDGMAVDVFPRDLINKAMEPFVDFIEKNDIKSDKNKIIEYNDYPFIYYNETRKATISSLEEYRKRRDKKNESMS